MPWEPLWTKSVHYQMTYYGATGMSNPESAGTAATGSSEGLDKRKKIHKV
jgi:hypothetical protein